MFEQKIEALTAQIEKDVLVSGRLPNAKMPFNPATTLYLLENAPQARPDICLQFDCKNHDEFHLQVHFSREILLSMLELVGGI